MISISVTIRPKFMTLAAILIFCKVEGQDVKIIFGIHHLWIQHAQIKLKSHRYRFFPHLHLRCLYYWNGPSLITIQKLQVMIIESLISNLSMIQIFLKYVF